MNNINRIHFLDNKSSLFIFALILLIKCNNSISLTLLLNLYKTHLKYMLSINKSLYLHFNKNASLYYLKELCSNSNSLYFLNHYNKIDLIYPNFLKKQLSINPLLKKNEYYNFLISIIKISTVINRVHMYELIRDVNSIYIFTTW